MKNNYKIWIWMPVIMGIFAFSMADGIIERLGLKHEIAQNAILTNITATTAATGQDATYFFLPRINTLPAILKGDKVAAALELAAYINMYVNSAEFITSYNQKREGSKPAWEPEPMSEEVRESLRQSIRDMENSMAEIKKQQDQTQIKDLLPMLEDGLMQQRATLAEYEDPTPNKTKWERNYPADPAVLVKKRLNEYLKLAASVDFSAALQQKGSYYYFVNPEYEKKSNQWKACYRAGKEVNDALVLFVMDWLKGDIISSSKVTMPKDYSGETTASPAVVHTNDNSNVISQQDAVKTNTEQNNEPIKEKKGLLGKIKDNARNIINN